MSGELVLELDGAVPLLHVSVLLRGGTVLDPVGKEGTTRLLLRMLRRSAGGRSADECDEHLDRLGASLIADASRSVAGLHGACLARTTGPFLAFLAEALCQPRFSAEEFERVRREAREELLAARDDDGHLARRFWSRRFFRGHPFGRPASGTPDSLARIELRDLEAQYARLIALGPPLISLAGAGEETALRAWAAELTSRLASSARGARAVGPEPLPEPPRPTGRQLLLVDKPLRTQAQLIVGCAGSLPADEDHTALYLGHVIFGGTFGARLSQEVRVKRGWSYGAYSQLPIERLRQPFLITTVPRTEDAPECLTLLLSLLERLIERGVGVGELRAAKKYLIRSHVFSVDTAAKRAGLALDVLGYGLPSDYYSGFEARVARVTREEVHAALRRRLSAEDLLIGVLGTQADLGDAIVSAVPRVSEIERVAYDLEL